MFSKEESRRLRQEFWTSFGKSFPRKWILYNTKIKDFSFKFHFERKRALVSLDIEDENLENRIKYWEKMTSLGSLFREALPEAIFDETHYLDNGKEISRIYVLYDKKVSVYNKDTWREVMEFFYDTMAKFEEFYYEYEDFIKA